MAPVRRTPYKDFLQPSLQRRFSSTTTILLAIAYAESIVFAVCRSPKSVFSSWWSSKLHMLQLASYLSEAAR